MNASSEASGCLGRRCVDVDVGALACRSMDRDNSGSISANELANVAVGGSVLGIDNGMKLIRVFDVDGNVLA